MTNSESKEVHERGASAPTEYDLAIDEQTDRFLSLQHQLTYFLVTAAIVPLGFCLKVVAEFKGKLPYGYWTSATLVFGGLAALVSAGSALAALRADISSHRRHIASRYKRKSYDDLSSAEKKAWDQDNSRAKRNRNTAFTFLIIAVALEAAFFTLVAISKGG